MTHFHVATSVAICEISGRNLADKIISLVLQSVDLLRSNSKWGQIQNFLLLGS